MNDDSFHDLLKKVAHAPSVVPKKHFTGTARYDIGCRLGSGGFGVVYEAFDTQTETRVALKTLHHMGPHSIRRLKNEFRSLQDLVHPNLCSLGDLIHENGEWFFTMELLEGTDFIRYCRTSFQEGDGRSHLREKRLRSALEQLSLGLIALHGAGKIHRDIKPSNVLVTSQHRTVVLDFGLVAEASELETDGEIGTAGTVAYMAPEQTEQGPVDHKADCYAMGVLLFEALTGALPFTGTSREIMGNKQRLEAPSPTSIDTSIPADLSDLCTDLLQIDKNRRPSAKEVLKRLMRDDAISKFESDSHISQSHFFVGRNKELGALKEAFLDTHSGNSVKLLVEGDSGIGKTELINHFAKHLAREYKNVLICKGRCYERESVPYKALDGIVDALANYLNRMPTAAAATITPKHAALLSRIFPVLSTVEAIGNAPMPERLAKDPFEMRRRSFEALRELFFLLGQHKHLVLIIDDLQWADKDSWILLSDIMRGPNEPKLLLILSSRPTEDTHIAHRFSESSDSGHLRHLRLGPLKTQKAEEFAEELIARTQLSRKMLAKDIVIEAKGHPLYIRELIRHGSGAKSSEGRPRLDDAIRLRKNKLSDEGKNILECACLAGSPISPQILKKATGIETGELWACLSTLRQIDLIRSSGIGEEIRVEPYHDRVREAIVSNICESSAMKKHADLALAWQEAGAPSELLLKHWEEAKELRKAAICAKDAAKHASRALAFDRAAELYKKALNLGFADDRETGEIHLQLAKALANAGRGPEAAQAFILTGKNASNELRLECLRQAAEQLLVSGYIEPGLATLNKLFGEIGAPLPWGPARSLLSLLANRFWIRLRGIRPPETPIAPNDSKIIRLEAYESIIRGFGMVDFIRAADYQARALLLALETGDRLRIGKALAYAAPFLGSPGGRGHGEARKYLRDAKEIARSENSNYLNGIIESIDGFLTLHEGNMPEASRIFEQAEAMLKFETKGTAWELASTRILRILALRTQGRFCEVEKLYDEYTRDASRRGDMFTETTVKRMCARIWLVHDQPHVAKRDIENSLWVDQEHGSHLQHFLELEARVELSLYGNNPLDSLETIYPIYERLRNSMWFRVKMVRSETRSLWGRLWLGIGALGYKKNQALRAAKRGARSLHREKLGYVEVLSLVLKAGIAALENNRAKTVDTLKAIVPAAEREQMAHIKGAAYYRLGQVTGGKEGERFVDKGAEILAGMGVVRFEPFTRMLIPGFTQKLNQ